MDGFIDRPIPFASARVRVTAGSERIRDLFRQLRACLILSALRQRLQEHHQIGFFLCGETERTHQRTQSGIAACP